MIPAREYGGGDVIVWDAGTWILHVSGRKPSDPRRAVEAGEIHVDLEGQKLRGRFILTRTGAPSADREDWLLLHKHDSYAVAGWNPEDHATSVLSGRTNDEVQADPERLWRSGAPAAEASVLLKPTSRDVEADELAQLDDFGRSGTWSVFDREVKVTNLDKVLFPPGGDGAPVTKRDLLRYAAQIAPTVLPYLARRALNMHRFPNGVQAKGFWHKQLPSHAPGWLPRWDNPGAEHDESQTYLVVDEPAALVWAANYGALEWHAWTSRVDAPKRPTYALIDLDPGPSTAWEDLLVLARLHRTALDHLGVRARAKVTGSRGIQIWVPVQVGPDFAATRRWVEQLSKSVGQVVPELVSWKWHVEDREGRARLDYTQNAVNKTLVAPYSPRPAPGAPVSAPIDWDELDDPELRPDAFTVRTIGDRLAEKGDLFADVLRLDQHLSRLS